MSLDLPSVFLGMSIMGAILSAINNRHLSASIFLISTVHLLIHAVKPAPL